MKALLALAIICAMSFTTLSREKASADVRAECFERIQQHMGRGLHPVGMAGWPASEARPGVWLVEAKYQDRGSVGSQWCQLRATDLGFALLRIDNRYQEAVEALRHTNQPQGKP